MEDPLVQLVRIAKADDTALLILYEKLLPLVKKWSYKMRLVGYSMEDWEQEAFIMLGHALRHYEEIHSIHFAAYFRMILYRKGLEYMRKTKDCLLFEEDEKETLMPDESIHIEADFIEDESAGERRYLLTEAMACLDEEEREIIRLFYFEGKSISEIAKYLDRTYNGIECKKRRILNKMKKRLEKVTEKEKTNYIH